MAENSKIKDVIETATALVTAVPLYQDLAQPAIKELSKSLTLVAKSVNLALAPLAAAIWGYEKIQIWLEARLVQELKDLPSEKIISPNPHVVGPTIEALRYTGNSVELRELFAKLIATSMSKDMAENAHPTFVEIIKQISSDEAKIIPAFLNNEIHPFITIVEHSEDGSSRTVMAHWNSLALTKKCDYPAFISIYLENLERLGILEFNENAVIEDEFYMELQNTESIKELLGDLSKFKEVTHSIERGIVSRTMLGSVFMEACIGGISGTQAILINK